jgi:hypothetical protein
MDEEKGFSEARKFKASSKFVVEREKMIQLWKVSVRWFFMLCFLLSFDGEEKENFSVLWRRYQEFKMFFQLSSISVVENWIESSF